MIAPLLALMLVATPARPADVPAFRVTALGVQGGLAEGDLTSFLVQLPGKPGILLDAGTLLDGLRVAHARGAFPDLDAKLSGDVVAGKILRERVKAVLVTHAHLDHVAGLVIASTDDVPPEVIGLPSTIDALRDHAFNWSLWPNLANEGKAPAIGKLRYTRLGEDTPRAIDGTGLTVTALPLSHGGVTSTAFLVEAIGTGGTSTLAFLGDTGPDAVEKSDRLARLWQRLLPLAKEKRLAAIFIETSYPSSQPDNKLYGHLTPRWLLQELAALGPAARGVRVVVMHTKPSLAGANAREVITRELHEQNQLGVTLVLPRQGDVLELAP